MDCEEGLIRTRTGFAARLDLVLLGSFWQILFLVYYLASLVALLYRH